MEKQRTLVVIKPEGVKRHLVGKIITRFEDAGLKIIGMKQSWIDKKFAEKHYTDDIAKRRGEIVRKKLLEHITEGPVIAFVLEGIEAVENVRKIVGGTEPKSAPPGTIRGDFAHANFTSADDSKKSLRNIIHASGNEKEAEYEIKLWFSPKELYSYKTMHDFFM